MPLARLQATASRETIGGSAAVRVRLRNPSAHLSFQVRLAVMDKNDEEVLPVFWNGNYIELMPGEARTITARYPSWTKPAAGAELEVSGWNIVATHVPLASPAGASSTPARGGQ